MGARTHASESTVVEHVEAPARAPSRDAVVVGSVNDPAEADADRLADRALSLAGSYQGANLGARSSDSVRRSATADVDGLSVDSSALAGARSGGTALDGDVRAKLEHGFDTDLGAVRVHTGSAAAGIARQISARAFTHGNDVYFGAGEYRPGTADGDHVLAHEVAHTVQNGNADGVHRFPATWSTSPVPWKPLTASVFRPGEGASGGVYILTSKEGNGPVKKAVVKPVSGKNGLGLRESGEQLQFSDAALGKLLGLSSPTSKVVRRGGSEFKDLVDLCQSKQPPSVDGAAAGSLADSESFVVMSEVPNASSIASLADKAPTNRRASADLFRAVFDPTFLAELGKLCIGDLMVGNPDRMVLGAMNLGNVMVSMQQGRASLAAIDTTTYLPKTVTPGQWKQDASGAGGFNTVKTAMDKGPGDLLDGFFQTLVNRLKSGTPDTAGPNPTWDVIDTTYKANRDRYLASFEFGWNDAMITALSFSEDDDTIDSVTAGYNDDDVTGSTLKANLAYLGGRAEGKSHDESIGRSMAITAASWAKTIDLNRLVPPSTDSLAPSVAALPTGKAVAADVVSMPSLPTAKNLKLLGRPYASPLGLADYNSLPKFAERINIAHTEVNGEVAATKSRRKGAFGKKEEQPRNRSVVSHYIVHASAMAAGGARVGDAASYSASVVNDAKPLSGADFRGNEAAPVTALLRNVGMGLSALDAGIATYQRQLATAITTVPDTKHADKVALVGVIGEIDTYLQKAKEKIGEVKKLDPQRMAARMVPRSG